MSESLDLESIRGLLELAIAEDLPSGDVTSQSVGITNQSAHGEIRVKQDAVVCGLPVLNELARLMGRSLVVDAKVVDGTEVCSGTLVASCAGDLGDLLAFERTALNFLQHLSGIATHVRSLVAQVHHVELFDTRKTTPGYRELEKYAVRIGGGRNHRMSLSDQVLIKDNHVDGVRKTGGELVRQARSVAPKGVLIEIEVRHFEELEEVLHNRPDVILLDNMAQETLEKSIAYIRTHDHSIPIEISGNITKERFEELENLARDYKNLRASMGSLTYGAGWIDFSLIIQMQSL